MQKVKDLILFLLEDVGEPMTTYEVAQHLDISWSTALRYLVELALEGKIERIEEINRRQKVLKWVIKNGTIEE